MKSEDAGRAYYIHISLSPSLLVCLYLSLSVLRTVQQRRFDCSSIGLLYVPQRASRFLLLLRAYDHALHPESGSVDEVGGCHQVFFGAPKLVS